MRGSLKWLGPTLAPQYLYSGSQKKNRSQRILYLSRKPGLVTSLATTDLPYSDLDAGQDPAPALPG